jgi:hypothetical protein
MDALKRATLRGELVMLVPYEEHFVTQYNAFLRDEELQQLTASEPLSLEEEYALCRRLSKDPHSLTLIMTTVEDATIMIGDVNIHLDSDDATVAEVCELGPSLLCLTGAFATRLMSWLPTALREGVQYEECILCSLIFCACTSVCLCRFFYLSIYLPIYLSISSSLYLSISIYLYLSV